MADSNNHFFKDGSIQVKKLSEWLDWAGGAKPEVFVALPMIQRGSVWKPNQIIELWDTLLRGMPVGSLMAQTLHKDEKVRLVGGSELEPIPPNGGLSLLDGQQRTLTMLIPWQKNVKMDKKVWVDFGDKPQDEHLYRLRVTTENHPFGFQKASPSARLSLGDRNKARRAHDAEHPNDKDSPNADIFEHSKPWTSVLPIDLEELIALWNTHNQNREAWETDVIEKLEKIKHFEFIEYEEKDGKKAPKFKETTPWNDKASAEIKDRITDFYRSLERLFSLQIPIIEVRSEMLDANKAGQNETKDDISPPLAVLFKRIGTGGTALTDADYVYSLIKHRLPEAYTLVETLHKNENIASLLSATNLVMSAVRLATAEFNDTLPDGDKKRISDWESPNKQQFHSLLKQNADFIKGNLKPLISVDDEGHGKLVSTFNALSELLKYHPISNEIGLPKYAFPLLNRPLVQVLLRWVRQVQLQYPNDAERIFSSNRKNIIRFALYWRVFVLDAKEASILAFKVLVGNIDLSVFPDKAIYEKLIEKEQAIAIVSPDNIKHIAFSKEDALLRGWKRFEIKKDTASDEVQKIKQYQRWWGGENGHIHPILLWLQRDFVSTFDGDPMAGRDDETPYDYDHICPSSHWYNNSKSEKGKTRIIDWFDAGDSQGHWRVGNSIGNLRVWGSSANRSDGDDAPSKKLKLNEENDKRKELLQQSAIADEHDGFWRECSGIEGKGREWNEKRTKAFQRAVEVRAFSLYEHYYQNLDLKAWLLTDSKQ